MEIDVKEIGLYQVITVRDKLDLPNVHELKKVLFSYTDGKYQHVAVDLQANRTEMSSSVIGTLIYGQKKLSANKGTLAILCMSNSLKELFYAAGLKDFFVYIDNPDELFFS